AARWPGVPGRARRRCSILGPTRVQEERRGRPGRAAPYASNRNLMSPPSSDRRAEFLARAQRGGMVPVVREVVLDADTPVAAWGWRAGCYRRARRGAVGDRACSCASPLAWFLSSAVGRSAPLFPLIP